MKWILTRITACVLVALWWVSPVWASVAVDTIGIDLNPLIDVAARSREQFALNVPYSISSAKQGTWSQRGSTSTWLYSARIPTAISVSFHAVGVVLPRSAVLTVSTAQTASTYTARNLSHGGLWGRPMVGDTVTFSLSVDSSEASRVRFQIEGLQAGYRSLGSGIPDHPRYREIMKAAATSAGCTQNYSCNVTTANQGPAHATVAVIVSNLYQCTGTLLNDTNGDGTPYVLTARHCQTGQLAGGNPDAAASVSIYWDTVSQCGAQLGSIYDSATISQTGATTALEQQDIWLIKLDSPPVANDAFYAGWDATGTAINGGYTIHDALGENEQYVAWNGTDLLERISGATLNIPYDSTFWGVVNSVGNVGAGASGSALFSPNNQVIGSASLAELTAGANSAGICPANPPANPTPSSVTALFTTVSGVWTSTADRTSSTPDRTLKTLLDPIDAGVLTMEGLPTQPITITASQTSANTGDTITLTWNAQADGSCTARGGSPGDGWTGPQPSSGSVQITNAVGGTITYSLSCHTASQIGNGSATVAWDYIAPVVNLTGVNGGPLMLGATTAISWVSNVGPCVATGGTSGDGWAGPQPTIGSLSLTITQTGLTQYTLKCGTAPRIATGSIDLDGVSPPHITLYANVTQIRVDAPFELSWFGNGSGGVCTASGGSSTDNWAATANLTSNGTTSINETAAGTYVYTLTCTAGGQSASSSATVVVTADPPAISLTAIAPEQQVYPTTGAASPVLNLLWSSNVNGCSISYTSNSGMRQAIVLSGGNPGSAVSDSEETPGLVTYTLECGTLLATASINWITTATPTPNALSVGSTSWAANVAYPISWNASSGPCVGSGGATGDGWAGSKAQSGTQSIAESQPGTYVFTLACGSGAATITSEVVVIVPSPYIQIYSSGGGIAWNSTVGPCTYVDGSSGNGLGESVPTSGSTTPTPATSGTYLFALTCGSGANTLYSATLSQIKVNAPTILTASVQSTTVDSPVTLTWSSDGSSICYATGGDGSAPWEGTLPGPGSGALIVTSRSAVTVTYGISCDQTKQVTVTYLPVAATSADVATPTVTLSASASSVSAGQSVSLSWSAKNAAGCSATGGQQGDGWSGSLASSGSMPVTETNPGTVTYSITCTGAPPAAMATATVVVSAAAASSSHGGGGALDLVFLLSLTLPLGLRVILVRRSFPS